ncbi:plastidal glycolate/glycerate translocator 1, chloroplastic [Cocos nucifera]|uniref:Plastidal glycolate/glycerate translocator 1, chloroplastic n=1 Tax=Cocos nucifera TaxID=13894 RepID=A0A8K0IE21_COCNU|nr:plastidal glycolate/glycerate translocator 1, chloroplastic [Cocos nucifera]
MFCLFSVLMFLDYVAPSAAIGLTGFFEPATLFIQRWLPLFYVPMLVVLPLAVRDIPAASGLKICFIIGYTAITVRRIVKTEMIPAEPMTKPSPFASVELWVWTAIFISTFVLAFIWPTALGTSARTCLPFLLAATVLGYMVGSGLPSKVKKVFHPIICCAFAADLAALAYGYFSQSGMDAVLADYLTKVSSNPGAGDFLMGFLGSVIISFAFSMFKQRKVKSDIHCIKPLFFYNYQATCFMQFSANSSLTAAAVVLTGLAGANFVQAVLDKLRLHDPIARGIATASSAHGLGTAALSAKEPEALPFCAIAYALTGILGSLLCSVPVVRQSLLLIVKGQYGTT